MLIRSQDKETIVPIGHGYITLTHYNNRSQIIFSVINENDAYLALGSYSTEEKAVKVLDMIQSFYSDNGRPVAWHNAHKVFKMPTDEELDGECEMEIEEKPEDYSNYLTNLVFGRISPNDDDRY